MVEMAVARCKQATDANIARQEAALAIVMAVNAVEVFLNLYFRVVVEEDGFEEHKSYLLGGINKRKGLDFKVKNWPRKILGNSVDLSKETGKEFYKLKELRNSIVHFTSSHDTVDLGGTGVIFKGLAETSSYNSLQYSHARNALDTSRRFVEQIFRLRGIEESLLPHALHSWCGVPINKSSKTDAEKRAAFLKR
tara:strand:+ start:271 stop:852 length:582 start_codon:yes stop_codon:yes gene_type:complete